MSQILATIENNDIILNDDGSVTYSAKAAIDDDGSDNSQRDPDWQADTSLHFNGKPIDAASVPYVVVPPAIIAGVPGIVLGCRAVVTDTCNGLSTEAVVADIGPHKKLGEISMACAAAIGIDPSPTRGGEDAHVIAYALYPGTPAVVNGVTYELQPSSAN
jgi:hypothetical protein